jgi:methylenetetrahydrofolate dehydrogenase (NADP+)/methenyltetrahydrofolate cyclohydrolase
MVKKDAVVIDVAISRVDGKIIGDATEGVKERASYLSQSPGGIGPITCSMLMKNVLIASRNQL